ncbi:MAG: MFS transporter [Ardenticatenales bacterium]|nr:MFS transporter [Ardenticatenales bacterium]
MSTVKEIESRPTRIQRLGVLAVPAFAFLFFGQLVSLLGDHVYRVGLTWYVTQRFGGVLAGANLGLAMSLPMAVFALFAGVIVDRFNRFRVMIVSDFVRMIIVSGILFLLLAPAPNRFLVYASASMLTVFSILFSPALMALLPDLADGDHDRLIDMNSWITGLNHTMNVVGPGLAGVFTAFHSSWLLGFDALTFAFSGAMILFTMRVLSPTQREKIVESEARVSTKSGTNVLANAREGMGFFLKHPVLRPQFLVFPLVESVEYSIPFLLPGFLEENLVNSGQLFAALLASWSLGRVLGIVLIARTPLKGERGKVFTVNFFIHSLALLMFLLASSRWLSLIAFAILGIPAGAAQVSMNTYIQTEVSPDMRGRVFAGLISLTTWLIPLGPIVFGAIARWQSTSSSFLIMSILLFAAGVYIASHRAVREVK